MIQPLLALKNIVVNVNQNTSEQIMILKHLNLTILDGDFITVLGSNGAGKSTLFDAISGNIFIDSGDILLRGKSITHDSVEQRTRFLSRVFQDPKLGTAPRMTVAENLLLAKNRGRRHRFVHRKLKQSMTYFKEITSSMENGIDQHLNSPTETLSGGQRQSLSFLMATLQKPTILLLDEHTAALDPKTSQRLMKATNERITEQNLTCLMITHNLEDALTYGNRLIVINDGKIIFDVSGNAKKILTHDKLLESFSTSHISPGTDMT